MKRQLELIDLMVVVGLCATVLGGLGLFVATSGSLAAGYVETMVDTLSAGILDPMQWVQPALGDAIVSDVLLGRAANQKTIEAATAFDRARLANDQLQSAPLAYLERIAAHDGLVEADHAARLQFVMGQRIVNATLRGIRAGIYQQVPAVADRYNRRLIRTVELNAIRMDNQYRQAHQPLLGWEIVAATQIHEHLQGQVQERLGHAIVQSVMVQEAYGTALAGAQEQLATVTLAAIHQERVADRFARLAAADSRQVRQPLFSGPRSWPEIPMGIMVALSFGLIGIFLIGVSTPSPRHEAAVSMEPLTDVSEAPYRKTA